MNPVSFNEFNSTYYVNRRRKEAIIEPLQSIITDIIETQLAQIHSCRQRLQNANDIIVETRHTEAPLLQDLSLDSLFRGQEVTLQEIKAQTERAIEIVLADTEDVDPLSTEWTVLATHNANHGPKLVKNPTVYLPLDFYRCRDRSGTIQSIPINPSEYLPSDEAYFQATGALDPPRYVVTSNLTYISSHIHRTRTYSTKDADSRTNKFYCRLEPPPPISNQSISLPNEGDTFLRDGSPYYKKLDKGDSIYIPDQRKYGRVTSWRFGNVYYQPTWIFSNLSNTVEETDHWKPIPASDPAEIVSFGSFVIKIASPHPTRRLLAFVSPYTVSDSDYLLSSVD